MSLGKIFQSALEAAGLPAEVAGALKLSLTGDSHLLIENHRGLLEYSLEQVCVSGGRLRARVRGDGLCLVAMDSSSLIIKGKIFGIDME